MLERFRRFKFIDSIFRTLEAYTSLGEQYPWIRNALNALVGLLLGGWALTAESWIPLGIVTGLAAFVALSLLPAAVQSRPPEKASEPAPKAPEALTSDAVLSRIDSRLERIDEQIKGTRTSLETQIGMVAEKLYAHQTLYELHRITPQIARLTKLLDGTPKKPEGERNWELWHLRFKVFVLRMHQFAAQTRHYYPKEADQILAVPPHIYRNATGDFDPSLFSDHQTAHDFKTFRYMSTQYEAVASDIVGAIRAKC